MVPRPALDESWVAAGHLRLSLRKQNQDGHAGQSTSTISRPRRSSLEDMLRRTLRFISSLSAASMALYWRCGGSGVKAAVPLNRGEFNLLVRMQEAGISVLMR